MHSDSRLHPRCRRESECIALLSVLAMNRFVYGVSGDQCLVGRLTLDAGYRCSEHALLRVYAVSFRRFKKRANSEFGTDVVSCRHAGEMVLQ